MPVREAARKFAKFAGASEGIVDGSVEDRLRRKSRTPLTGNDMAAIETLLDRNAPATRALITILELLENFGVKSKTIWDVDI